MLTASEAALSLPRLSLAAHVQQWHLESSQRQSPQGIRQAIYGLSVQRTIFQRKPESDGCTP